MPPIQVQHVFNGETQHGPWQQKINLLQSYSPLKCIDFELKISSVETKLCVLFVSSLMSLLPSFVTVAKRYRYLSR